MANFEKTLHGGRFLGIAVCAIALLLGVSCSVLWLGQNVWEPPQLVSIEGKDGCAVFYWHGLEFFTRVQKGQAISLPIRNGDILLTEDEHIVLYRSSDGQSLGFSGDKARLILNGSTFFLKLDKDEAWKWLQRATPEEIKGLRLLNIENEVNAQQVAQLQRIAKVNPAVGLRVTKYETWREIAKMFDPAWLMIGGDLQEQDLDTLTKKKNIRTLGIGNPEHNLNFLSKISGLETLIIEEWNISKTGPIPENLPSLRRIILFGSNIADLAPLGKQSMLQEMNIQAAYSLEDLTLLTRFPELRLLSLHESKKRLGLGQLKNLKKMKWLSLPESTTQEQLTDIIRNLPDLVFLDLSECKEITDLTPVQKLPGLRYLAVNIARTGPDSLYKMKHLKWLAVTGKKGEDGEARIKEIQEALPDTDLVLLVPFCLGSGWILLVLPIIVLSWWITRRREKMGLFVRGDHG